MLAFVGSTLNRQSAGSKTTSEQTVKSDVEFVKRKNRRPRSKHADCRNRLRPIW